MVYGFVGGLPDLGGEGCDLPDRLMKSLQAVPLRGQGDIRCLEADIAPRHIVGVPAAGAFMKVEADDGTVIVDIDVIGDGSTDPTIELKAQYDIWRAANPCPAPVSGQTKRTTSPKPDRSGASFIELLSMSIVSVATIAVLLF